MDAQDPGIPGLKKATLSHVPARVYAMVGAGPGLLPFFIELDILCPLG